MTHIFQPCDQYIIANFREYLIREWNVPAKGKRGGPLITDPIPLSRLQARPQSEFLAAHQKAERAKKEREQAYQQSSQDTPPRTLIPEATEIDVLGEEDENGIEIVE
jgi:hypothetical protein